MLRGSGPVCGPLGKNVNDIRELVPFQEDCPLLKFS